MEQEPTTKDLLKLILANQQEIKKSHEEIKKNQEGLDEHRKILQENQKAIKALLVKS